MEDVIDQLNIKEDILDTNESYIDWYELGLSLTIGTNSDKTGLREGELLTPEEYRQALWTWKILKDYMLEGVVIRKLERDELAHQLNKRLAVHYNNPDFCEHTTEIIGTNALRINNKFKLPLTRKDNGTQFINLGIWFGQVVINFKINSESPAQSA